MRQSINLLLKLSVSFAFLFYSFLAQAVTPMTIKKETPEYIIDIKYPQGFKSAKVNSSIKEFIAKTQDSFMHELSLMQFGVIDV